MDEEELVDKIFDKIEEIDDVVEVQSMAYERDYLINNNLRIEAEIETKKEVKK